MAVIRKYRSNIGASLQPIAAGSTARIRLDPASQANLASAPFTQVAQGIDAVGKYAEKIFELDQAAEKKKREAIILSRSLDLETYYKTSPNPSAFDSARETFYWDATQNKHVKHLHPSDNKPLQTFTNQWKKVEADALKGVTGSRLKTQVRSALMIQEMKLRNSLGLDALNRTRKMATVDWTAAVMNERGAAVAKAIGDGNYTHLTDFLAGLKADGTRLVGMGTLTPATLNSLVKTERQNIAKQVINAWRAQGNKSYTEIANALQTGHFATASTDPKNIAINKLTSAMYRDILQKDPTLKGRIESNLLKNASDQVTAKSDKLEIADAKRQFATAESNWLTKLTSPLGPDETRQSRIASLRSDLTALKTNVGVGGLGKEFNALAASLDAYEDGFAPQSDPDTLSQGREMAVDKTLTFDWLNSNKDQLDEAGYSELIKAMKPIRNDAEKEARNTIKRASRYDLATSLGGSRLPANERRKIEQNYQTALTELDAYLAENPRASRADIRAQGLVISAKLNQGTAELITSQRDLALSFRVKQLRQNFKGQFTDDDLIDFESIAKFYEKKGQANTAKQVRRQAATFKELIGNN